MGLGKGLRVHLPQEKCTSLPPKLDPQPLEKKFFPDGVEREEAQGAHLPRFSALLPLEFEPLENICSH